MPIKREIAYHVSIQEILDNKYVVNSESETNYFLVDDKKISRVNIIAVITNIQEKVLTIDDGYCEIILRDFNDKISPDLKIGDIVLIVGRPREYNDEKYIVPEIIKKLENTTWMELRQKDLNAIKKIVKPIKEIIKIDETENNLNGIKDIININDKGEGVPMKIILEKIENESGEEEIKKLLKMGEIYEIKPGIFKIL